MEEKEIKEKIDVVFNSMMHEIKGSKTELTNILDKIGNGEGVRFKEMISKTGRKNSYKSIKDAENKAGVYFIYNTENKKVVYVGESTNWCLKKRMSQHCAYHKNTGNIIKNMIVLGFFNDKKSAIQHLREHYSIYYITTGDAKSGVGTEIKTKTLETFSILALEPKYNIDLNR